MNEKQIKGISKFLSYVLRHNPQEINLSLDANGWASVNELIEKARIKNIEITIDELEVIVSQNDKQRFTFNDEHTKIRASQGHSINIELDLKTTEPPEYLYHGTVTKFINAIKSEGLKKMSRQHVHLSMDRTTAEKVGSRIGIPVILSIRSGAMHRDGFPFFISDNGVWLTDSVPNLYIEF
ncbi:RNA 2'-phosphotransferase [Solitalea canadensis]|uniref:Probable RNA 2'-phosphotransferase n=1 Tax=Solitalea canadensis (strain ATCC 29591 / DSM 3403 / JCM 21819 / LMG 8368 / NBRC 15130 / NCIMB 12057 / USAM 9D) TaxID=929556 RepID=H8KPL6_SOLCM|nr:RNA 2'-phosphotransferase [Solitalea canadensis]AFD05914.1 RNA:NAD 2'-phosphotransferase [Solitalea canadensis DSM 3403]